MEDIGNLKKTISRLVYILRKHDYTFEATSLQDKLNDLDNNENLEKTLRKLINMCSIKYLGSLLFPHISKETWHKKLNFTQEECKKFLEKNENAEPECKTLWSNICQQLKFYKKQ